MSTIVSPHLSDSQASSINLFVGCLFYLSQEAKSEELNPVSDILNNTIRRIQKWMVEEESVDEQKLLDEIDSGDMLNVMKFLHQVMDLNKSNPESVKEFISFQDTTPKKKMN